MIQVKYNRALDVSVKQALASELRPHIKNETPKIALGHRRGCAGLLCRATVALRDRTGWLRIAVRCELVSAPNSLLTGKLTGNFANSGPQQRFPHLINELIQSLAAKFPTQRNREFLQP